MYKYHAYLVSLLILSSGVINAQTGLTTCGSIASGSSGTMSFSIGQVAYISSSSGNGTVSQGVQQPYEIFTSGISESDQDLGIKVFPNPTADRIVIDFKSNGNARCRYVISDIMGRTLFTSSLLDHNTEIDLSGQPASDYLLTIFKEDKKVSTYKIIKN